MRVGMSKFNHKRERFHGTFCKYGRIENEIGEIVTTILVLDVKDNSGDIISDHSWLTISRKYGGTDFKDGDKITFKASVSKYWKGKPDMGSRGFDNFSYSYTFKKIRGLEIHNG